MPEIARGEVTALPTIPLSLMSELMAARIDDPVTWFSRRMRTVTRVQLLPQGWWMVPVSDKGRWARKAVAVRFTQAGARFATLLWAFEGGAERPPSELMAALEAHDLVADAFTSAVPPLGGPGIEATIMPDDHQTDTLQHLEALRGPGPLDYATPAPEYKVPHTQSLAGDWVGLQLERGARAVATAPDRVLVVQPGSHATVVRLHSDNYAVSVNTFRFTSAKALGSAAPNLTEHARGRIAMRWSVAPEAAEHVVTSLLHLGHVQCPDFGHFAYAVAKQGMVGVFGRSRSGWRCVTAYPPFQIGRDMWNETLEQMQRDGFQGYSVDRDPAESGVVGDTVE